MPKYDVVVVGAGNAGLFSARRTIPVTSGTFWTPMA